MNQEKLKEYWIKYKEYFELPEPENDEKYKWSVLAQVFEKWDWNAENKIEMFKNAFEVKGNKNLWLSGQYFPISHTIWMMEEFPDETIGAFNNLFNESIPLTDRVKSFIGLYDEKLPILRDKAPDRKVNYHSHGDMRATALYLFLQNPNKYFLYKYTMVKDFCLAIGEPSIKMGNYDNLELYFTYSNEVLDFIKTDSVFLNRYNLFVNTKDKYKDESLHLLTQDIIYFISKSNRKLESVKQSIMNKEKNIFKEYDLFLANSNYAESTKVIYSEQAEYFATTEWKKKHNVEFNPYEYDSKKIYELINLCQYQDRYTFKGCHFFIKFLNSLLNVSQNPSLNTILYGSPGTGKTYHTKKLAVEFITGIKFEDNEVEREEILIHYNKLVKKGQIQFCTFHQSMSYEEFIEGIKPDNVDGNVIYEIRDGLFKSICNEANNRISNSFEDAYLKLINEFNKIDIIDLKTPTGSTFSVSLNRNKNLTLKTGEDKGYNGTLTKENILKHIGNEKKFKGWEGYFSGVVNYLKSNYGYDGSLTYNHGKYAIIIDEINRGNVSAIFGELITLIEEDKRKGNKEEIIVKLPYSNSDFSVPNNVYIIGTMNTADRSVEALDTALRRRFSFIEMPSRPELLDSIFEEDIEIDLVSLLNTINKRLEIIMNKDHQIGHAYFIDISTLDELKSVFKDKIIPLLEEYFFGDIGKICLVLGDNFMEQVYTNSKDIKQTLASSKYYKDIDFALDKQVFKVKDIDTLEASDFISIYQDTNIERE